MFNTTLEEIEIRGLGEMLAALCQVAQDAAGTQGASPLVERSGTPRELQPAEEGISRP